MRKALLFLLVPALAGALIAFLAFAPPSSEPADVADATPAATPAATAPEAAKPRETPHEGRARAAEPAPGALAVAGVVKVANGSAIAGAVVEAFAVPDGQDVPDHERAGMEMLTKLFGRPAAERLMARGKEVAAGGGSFDPDKMGDLMSTGMDMGLELLSDDGGMEGIAALMRLAR